MRSTIIFDDPAYEKIHFDRLYIRFPIPVDKSISHMAASSAVHYARERAPKLFGDMSRQLTPIWDEGHFGIRWTDPVTWYQEMGIRPFTMRSLEGKTIPMWIDDPTGEERSKNPKAKTRITPSGRFQILIFRKAAKRGARKNVKRRIGGIDQWVDVPQSYPGAPGRINRRVKGAPFTTSGGGRIARGNVGVRWRHPGMASKFFMHEGLLLAAVELGLPRGLPVEVAEQGASIDVLSRDTDRSSQDSH